MRKTRLFAAYLLSFSLLALLPSNAFAAEESQIKTKIKHTVKAVGEYGNWEGVSNVSQFIGSDGEFWFACDGKKKVTVVSTSGGTVKNKIQLEKKHDTFGAVCSDGAGNLYVVTGEENKGNNTNQETVFISKYDSSGNLVSTIGNNGSSSLASYFEESFFTKKPFDAGNCDVDVNGRYMAVNYARKMYNGHQSNSVWVIDTESMNTIPLPESPRTTFEEGVEITTYGSGIYNSHSFGQRAVKYKDGFLFASEGDAYERAFNISQWDLKNNTVSEDDIFHFWIKEGSGSDMSVVNNNFAHIGDLAVLSDGNAAFAATSAPSMTASAGSENEQIFIQIFNPGGDLGSASGYVTVGERSGTTGINGGVPATDYGVKWLTEGSKFLYRNLQMVSTGDKLVLLYEKYAKKNNKLKGVFYTVLDSSGNVVSESRKFKKSASLNPCETPIYANGYICWASNKASKKGKLFIYRIKI